MGNLPGYLAEHGANVPRLVHLDWTICSVKEFKVLEVASVYVNPDQQIDANTQTFTGVSQDVISKEGVNFGQAMQKVSSISSENFQIF